MQFAIGLIPNIPVVENQFIEPLPGKRTNRAWGEPVPGLFVKIIRLNPLKDFLQPPDGFAKSVYALFVRERNEFIPHFFSVRPERFHIRRAEWHLQASGGACGDNVRIKTRAQRHVRHHVGHRPARTKGGRAPPLLAQASQYPDEPVVFLFHPGYGTSK